MKTQSIYMSFYDLSINKPNGSSIAMQNYKGKWVLIINTATQCGLTPQFDGLEKIHQEYHEKGVELLGCPCNQFLNQEPETNETVEEACRVNHGVTFTLTEKIEVNGKNTHPLFAYLKKKKGGFFTSRIKWNFTKFLINPDGKVVKRYGPTVKPEAIERDLKKWVTP